MDPIQGRPDWKGLLTGRKYLKGFLIRLTGKDEIHVTDLSGLPCRILFILDGIEQTAEDIKVSLPQIYSRELTSLLFYEFCTKIIYIKKGLNITRKTASNYLSSLEEKGFLVSQKVGKEKILLNKRLFEVV
jgi:Fic family protein